MKRLMVDIEAMDSGNNAVVLSIGAKEFDPELYDKGWTGREFYVVAKQDLQVMVWERTVSSQTAQWWTEQSEDARAVFMDPSAVMLDRALAKFGEWIAGQHIQVWGNGATYDNVVLRNAYAAVGQPCPWGFREDMCFRTLKNFNVALGSGEGLERTGHHNALADAKYQAWYAERWLAKLGVR